MCPRRGHSAGRLAVMLVLALAGGGVLWAAAGDAASGDRSEPVRFDRPQPPVVRAELEKILSDPQFAPRKSVWQRIWEKLLGWRRSGLSFGGGWGEFLFWFITAWCVLTLLAIFGHMIWAAVVAFRASGGGGSAARVLALGLADGAEAWPYEQLCREMRRLAEHGAYRQAVSLMMLALLRLLDQAGVVRFDKSKTNREYLRECGSGFSGRDIFRRFVLAFDASVYGGVSCGRRTYEVMNALFERLGSDGQRR